MAPQTRKPKPLSILALDPRIRDLPIPLMFSENNTHAPLRETLLPYFALEFFPVNTGGGQTLECGLFALATSFDAARNEFRDRATTPAYPPIPIAQWKKWFHSLAYADACVAHVKSEPELYGWSKDSEGEILSELLARTNLDVLAMSIVLDIANAECGTHFQLGVVHAGWRGKLARLDPWVREEDGPTRAPLMGWFDNRHLAKASARLVRKMNNGPVLWVFNDSQNERSLEQEDEGSIGHWEGFRKVPNATEDDYHVRMVYDYGIGALLEADINDGVWFLMKDSFPTEKNPTILSAYAGSFLREPRVEHGSFAPKGYRRMRNCMNEIGLVRIAHLTKVVGGDRMPTADKDPSDAQKLVPSGPQVPAYFKSGFEPNTNRGDGGDGGGNFGGGGGDPNGPADLDSGNKTSRHSRSDALFEYQPFKFFRVIQATTKAGVPIKNHRIKFANNRFVFAIGDFVLDTGLRGECTAFVKDIYGVREEVPLRQLQALTRPWGLPDMLPFTDKSKYKVPKEFSDVIALAALHKFKDLDPTDEASMRAKMATSLGELEKSQAIVLEMQRIRVDTKRHKLLGTALSQEGEIVRISLFRKTDARTFVDVFNYEGGKNRIPKANSEPLGKKVFWSLRLDREEWAKLEPTLQYDL